MGDARLRPGGVPAPGVPPHPVNLSTHVPATGLVITDEVGILSIGLEGYPDTLAKRSPALQAFVVLTVLEPEVLRVALTSEI